MRIRRTVTAALLVGGSLILIPAPAQAGGFCQEGNLAEATGTTVTMGDNCYTPTILRAPVGAEVTFINKDPEAHTVTSAAGAWSDAHKEILPAGRISFRFEESGIYGYTCLIHPGMTGTIVVGDGLGAGAGAVEIEVEPVVDATGAVEDTVDRAENAADSLPVPAVTGAVAGLIAGGAGFELGRRRRLG
jgi:plastocyanin